LTLIDIECYNLTRL